MSAIAAGFYIRYSTDTEKIMFIITLLIIIILIVLGIYLFLRQRNQSPDNNPEENSAPENRTIFNLQLGDIVEYMGQDWVVEGKLIYEESGFTWLEYLLQDQQEIRWLSVEEDDRVELSWLQPTRNLDIPRNPPNPINFEGETYRCVDSGVAKMKREGSVMNRQAEECHYFDYESEDGKLLSVEDWNGDIEVTYGEEISPSSLSIFPGEGKSIYR
jgi:hypothetical protein